MTSILASLTAIVVLFAVGFATEWRIAARVGAYTGFRASVCEVTIKRLAACAPARRASRVLATLYAGAIGAAIGVRLLVPSLNLPGTIWVWIGVGLVLAVFATAIRGWALLTLGPLFDRDALVRDDHALLRRGPYRFIRHPAYTANLICAVAAGIILANWASILTAASLALIGHLPRIRFEEALLQQRFPHAYHDYHDQTGSLLPQARRHDPRNADQSA